MEGKVIRQIVSVVLLVTFLASHTTGTEFECEEGCRCTGIAINCSSSDLDAIPEFETIQGANIVDLSDNHINEIDDVLPWQGIEQLQFLYLNVNSIFYLKENAFSTLVNLEYVDLSNNYIEMLPGALFATNMRMSTLFLQGNAFQYNTPIIVSPTLTYLDMSFCKLSTFTWENVRYMPRLQYINLQVNNLVYLEPAIFQHHPGISLVLSFNYWACNCSTVELYRWALDNQPRIIIDEKCNTKNNIHVNLFNKTKGFLSKEGCDINEDTFGSKSMKNLSLTKTTSTVSVNCTKCVENSKTFPKDASNGLYDHAWTVFMILAFVIIMVAIAFGVVVGVSIGHYLNRNSYDKCITQETIFV